MSLERVWSEFEESLENLQTHKVLLDVIVKIGMIFGKKNEFGESPNSLQTQKNMRAHFFFKKNMRAALKYKWWTHFFF
jgi:hypothetical protein